MTKNTVLWTLAALAALAAQGHCGAFYDKKFGVVKHNHFNVLDEHNDANHTLYAVRADQVGYQCWVPHVADETDASSYNSTEDDTNTIRLEFEKNQAIEAIREFNFKHREQFVIQRNGYWNYMIRYDHDIHQFHELDHMSGPIAITDENVFVDFKLAAWSDNDKGKSFKSVPYYKHASQKNPYQSESDFELISTEEGFKYVTQRIGNGEICDLTGLPRSVTIKYLCNDKVETPTIRTIHEWKTCEYAIELESDYFCSFNMWTPPKDLISNDIHCYPESFNDVSAVEIIDLQQMTIEPMVSGIFLIKSSTDAFKYALLLTKDYDLWTSDIEGVSANEEGFHRLLTDISVGLQNTIRNRRIVRQGNSGVEAVRLNDAFKLITKLYNTDRTHIGNVQMEQDENGFIVSFFTDDDVPEESNFVEFHYGN